MLQRILFAPLYKRSYRRRGRVKDSDLVTLDNIPEAIEIRMIRSPFVHEDGGAIRQRPVDDITVPGDPSDIGRAPVNILVLQVEDHFGRIRRLRQIAAGGVQNSFWFSGGAGCV